MKFIKLLTLVVLPSLLFAHGKIYMISYMHKMSILFLSTQSHNYQTNPLKIWGLTEPLSREFTRFKSGRNPKIFIISMKYFLWFFKLLKVRLNWTLKNKVLADDFLLRKSSDRKTQYLRLDCFTMVLYQEICIHWHPYQSSKMRLLISQSIPNTVIGKLKDSKFTSPTMTMT